MLVIYQYRDPNRKVLLEQMESLERGPRNLPIPRKGELVSLGGMRAVERVIYRPMYQTAKMMIYIDLGPPVYAEKAHETNE